MSSLASSPEKLTSTLEVNVRDMLCEAKPMIDEVNISLFPPSHMFCRRGGGGRDLGSGEIQKARGGRLGGAETEEGATRGSGQEDAGAEAAGGGGG